MNKSKGKRASPKQPSRPATPVSDHYGYVHGYTRGEQDRLIRQARFFEEGLYRNVVWPRNVTEILEPGCGVGAQTEILLRRYPHLRVTGIDQSKAQLGRAREYLKKQISEDRVQLVETKGEVLPFQASQFHGAFICFVLEHVKKPVDLLREMRRTLQPGALIYCTEVLASSFFFHPYAPATLKFCFAFNDHQWNMGGDPFCGAKLGNHLMEAGFQNVQTQVQSYLLDKRKPKTRNAYLQEYYEMLMSGAGQLLEAKLIDQTLITEMEREWQRAMEDEDSVLFFSLVQARGRAL